MNNLRYKLRKFALGLKQIHSIMKKVHQGPYVQEGANIVAFYSVLSFFDTWF